MTDAQNHSAAERLRQSVERHATRELADCVACGVPLFPAATDAEKAAWVGHACGELERRFAPDTIRAIRKACHCREEGRLDEMKSWLGALYRESSSLAEFVEKVNAHGAGWYIEDGALYTKFLNCECYMLQGVASLESMTWCLCAEGYTEDLFRHVFGREVESELLQTIKTGHEFCLIAIRIT